ncbi:MAG TPA: hypothetical protein VM008_16330 [Phycisphaerae bacterium]|nr:hypothetical protein [Phycisphaerae bacterium]
MTTRVEQRVADIMRACPVRRASLAAALMAGALAAGPVAQGADGISAPSPTMAGPNAGAPTSTTAEIIPKTIEAPALTLDNNSAGPESSFASRIHGYGDLRLLSAHLTRRGVMTVDKGVVFQPSGGLVIDLFDFDGPITNVSFVTTVWADLNSAHPGTGCFEEFDYAAGVSVSFLKYWTANGNWMFWTFPDSDTPNMYNTDLKFTFNDESFFKQCALRPYVDLFWNYSGASPVVFGTQHTMYAEVGVEPEYVLHLGDYPVTFKFPTYGSFGDSSFWGDGDGHTKTSNLGVFSTGVRATVPLKFVPASFGKWSAYIGGTYIHTCNPSLTYANEFIGSGSTHERFVGFGGVTLTF